MIRSESSRQYQKTGSASSSVSLDTSRRLDYSAPCARVVVSDEADAAEMTVNSTPCLATVPAENRESMIVQIDLQTRAVGVTSARADGILEPR